MSGLQLTQDDKGKCFEVHRDDPIVIRLTENPTTGYRWTLEKTDDKILMLQSSEFFLPQEPKIGEGGTRVFKFKAKTDGSAYIRLKHWREWEGNDSIIDIFDVTTVVRN